MEHKYIRRVSTCYLLEEDIPFETAPIKICRTRRLAEHYKRILEPKWEEAFGFGLRVSEEKFYEDDGENVPTHILLERQELSRPPADEFSTMCRCFPIPQPARKSNEDMVERLKDNPMPTRTLTDEIGDKK